MVTEPTQARRDPDTQWIDPYEPHDPALCDDEGCGCSTDPAWPGGEAGALSGEDA